MPHARTALFGVFLVAIAPSLARATTFYGDGLVHSVSGPTADIQVFNGTTVNVLPGASIVGPSASMFNSPSVGITSSGPGDAIVVTGGTITGGSAGAPFFTTGADAANVQFSAVGVYGGTFVGGTGPLEQGNGLTATADTVVSLNGGSFTGGTGLLYISTPLFGTQLSISGGTFTGVAGQFTGDAAYLALGHTNGLATISGGTFNSPLYALDLTVTATGARTVVSGGLFNGGIYADLNAANTSLSFLGSNLNYVGGVVSGTLSDGTAIRAPITLSSARSSVQVLGTQVTFNGLGPVVVPEPATFLLTGTGLAGVALLSWRRSATGRRQRMEL